jgi:hypothetical protein
MNFVNKSTYQSVVYFAASPSSGHFSQRFLSLNPEKREKPFVPEKVSIGAKED